MNRALYDTHMHTPLCRHAVGKPEDYAMAAYSAGLSGVIITCHNPMPDGYAAQYRMALEDFPVYFDMVTRAREKLAGTVDVRLGLECDFVPDFERWIERQIKSERFDYVLGSVHPGFAEYVQRYWTNDIVHFQRTYFEHLALAAETGLFDALAHPDLVKNTQPLEWKPSRILDDIRRSLDRIAATGIAMELNTSGLNKDFPEMNPGPTILQEMRERGIPVVVGSDAHTPDRVGDGFDTALRLLKDIGYTSTVLIIGNERRSVPID